MNTDNPKDQLFYRLLCDLAQDIIGDTQLAAEQTIDLSSRFLDDDSQHLVDDFRTLCSSEATTEHSSDPAHLEIVQQNMDQVAKKNAAIRAEINVVLGSMQFSELLRQHLSGIQESFETMINHDAQDMTSLKLAMQQTMHTYDERKAFHEQVMHEQMPAEDLEITQDLIDQMIG